MLILPGPETGRSVLDVRLDVLRVHFTGERVHGAQVDGHVGGVLGGGVDWVAEAERLGKSNCSARDVPQCELRTNYPNVRRANEMQPNRPELGFRVELISRRRLVPPTLLNRHTFWCATSTLVGSADRVVVLCWFRWLLRGSCKSKTKAATFAFWVVEAGGCGDWRKVYGVYVVSRTVSAQQLVYMETQIASNVLL